MDVVLYTLCLLTFKIIILYSISNITPWKSIKCYLHKSNSETTFIIYNLFMKNSTFISYLKTSLLFILLLALSPSWVQAQSASVTAGINPVCEEVDNSVTISYSGEGLILTPSLVAMVVQVQLFIIHKL
jgi:hypothetical protein